MTSVDFKPVGPMRRPILTIAAAIAFVILIALGVWQLQRKDWKEDLIERVAAARAATPTRLQDLLAGQTPEALNFRRAFVYCPGLSSSRFVELYGIHEGRPGWRLVSICPLREGPYDAILVDRGWIPEDIRTRPPVISSNAVARAAGVLRAPEPPSWVTPQNKPGENRWYWRDISGMAGALGSRRPAPVMLTTDEAVPSESFITPVPLPAEIPNRHMGYALTWFGLAAALVAVYVALMLRGRPR